MLGEHRPLSEKPLIGLVMIVKDGEQTLPLTLESLIPYIDTWTICDTGSTDSTRKLIRKMLADIPGRLYDHKWRDFGHNRTQALARAKDTAQWLLFLDDDMALTHYHEGTREWLASNPDPSTDAWWVTIEQGTDHWMLPLLMRGDLDWRYFNPVHEYLDSSGRKLRQILGLNFTHFPDLKDESAKIERYIELLTPGYNARDPRATFYMAQTLRLAGKFEAARIVYEERARLNGFDEERWYATYRAAAIRGNVEDLIECWRQRPWRHEPLTEAGRLIHRTAKNEDILFLEQPG